MIAIGFLHGDYLLNCVLYWIVMESSLQHKGDHNRAATKDFLLSNRQLRRSDSRLG
jgi:hypothetical protein